jgi:hypothetical protein
MAEQSIFFQKTAGEPTLLIFLHKPLSNDKHRTIPSAAQKDSIGPELHGQGY